MTDSERRVQFLMDIVGWDFTVSLWDGQMRVFHRKAA